MVTHQPTVQPGNAIPKTDHHQQSVSPHAHRLPPQINPGITTVVVADTATLHLETSNNEDLLRHQEVRVHHLTADLTLLVAGKRTPTSPTTTTGHPHHGATTLIVAAAAVNWITAMLVVVEEEEGGEEVGVRRGIEIGIGIVPVERGTGIESGIGDRDDDDRGIGSVGR